MAAALHYKSLTQSDFDRQRISFTFNKDNTISYQDEGITKTGTFNYDDSRFYLLMYFSGPYFFIALKREEMDFKYNVIFGDLFFKLAEDEYGAWYNGMIALHDISRLTATEAPVPLLTEVQKLNASRKEANWLVGNKTIYQKWDGATAFTGVVFSFKSDGTFSTNNEAVVLKGTYFCEGFFIKIYCDNGTYYVGIMGFDSTKIEGDMVAAQKSGKFYMAANWGAAK